MLFSIYNLPLYVPILYASQDSKYLLEWWGDWTPAKASSRKLITCATALFVNDEGWQSLSLSMVSMLIVGDARLGVNTRQHMEQHLVGADPSDLGISNQFYKGFERIIQALCENQLEFFTLDKNTHSKMYFLESQGASVSGPIQHPLSSQWTPDFQINRHVSGLDISNSVIKQDKLTDHHIPFMCLICLIVPFL